MRTRWLSLIVSAMLSTPAGRMPHPTLAPAQRFGEGEDPGTLHEDARPGGRPEFQGNHAAKAAHLAAGQLILGVVREARVIHALYGRVALKPLGEAAAVAVVLPHPKRKGLGTAERQPAIKRSRDRPRRVLEEREAFRQVVAVGDDGAAHHVAMAVQVLGG